jgi:hypothetical protein
LFQMVVVVVMMMMMGKLVVRVMGMRRRMW